MFQLPPIPTLDGLHPLIIHFPIGLLLVAPVLILIGALVEPQRGRMFLIAALVLLVLGTGAIFVAVESGEAAGKLAERTPQVSAVLEQHEELAERTKLVFSVLTFVLAVVIFIPALFRREIPRKAYVAMPIVFLFFYSAGVLLLSNTAHNGGRLVHEFGVHAMVGPTANDPAAHPTSPAQDHDDDDHGKSPEGN